MLGYLKKFNNLPLALREKVSNPEAMAAIEKLEKKYRLPLAAFIMKVVVKEIALADLSLSLVKEDLNETAARQLAEELKEKIFFALKDYFVPPPAVAPVIKKEPAGAPKLLAEAPKPSARPLVKGASFFFSPDDEEEIRKLAEKIEVSEKIKLPAEKIEAELQAIINRVQINFGSVDLADRFKQILRTYLRGIRNRIETELALTKPFLSGGLSFDQDSARKVMTTAGKVLHPVKSGEAGAKLFNGVNHEPGSPDDKSIELSPKMKIPELTKNQESRPVVERDAPYDFSKLIKEKKAASSAGTLKAAEPPKPVFRPHPEDTDHELAPLTPARLAETPTGPAEFGLARQAAAALKIKSAPSSVQEKKPPLAKIQNKVSVPDKKTVSPVESADDTSQMPLIRRRFEAENLNQSRKAKVEDVKYVPRVMSSLDEIKYLDLINFRRLDKDPLRAVEKIKGKISLLEEEGYGKKLEAIKFWRSSPLNRLYLAIGHLSIGENKPVDVIIEERKMKAGDYLTTAEFEAIMDMNKSLRF